MRSCPINGARLLVALLVLAGCSAPPRVDPRPVEVDPVCCYYNDLGCIDVRVDEATPRATHKGRTYYFCTERCRVKFEKDPEKFVRGRD